MTTPATLVSGTCLPTKSWAGNLIGVREFDAVASVQADLVAISFAGQVSLKSYVRRVIHRYGESEVAYGIIL